MILRRPLLHIGLAKTGTTYLQRILAANVSNGYFHDEIQYLDYHWARWRLWLKIRRVSISGFPIVFSHEGLLGGSRWKTLAKMLNQPCVLVTTRDPLTWLQSCYKHEVRKGCPFEPKNWIIKRGGQFVRSLDFNRIRSEISSVIGEANVRFLPFELLRDDANAFLRELNQFVDGQLELVATPLEARNKSLPLPFLGWLQKINARLVEVVEQQNHRIEKSPSIAAETQGFVRRFPELRSALMMDKEMKIGIKNLENMINFLTKCLLQNVPENINLLPHLDAQRTDNFRQDMQDAFFYYIKDHLNGKLSCLNDEPAYDLYRQDYMLE